MDAHPYDVDLDLGVRHLRALLAVARYGNFAAAAADLGVSQPTLTRTIQHAEEVLGAELFTRTTRHVAITAAGREFLPLAERLLSDLGLGLRNIRELATVERGRIVVATLMSVAHGVLPTALGRFAALYPSVEINVCEGVQARVLEEVHSGSVDFGLGDTAEIGGALVAEPLGENGCCVALPAGHPLARRKSVALDDLVPETLISMPTDSAMRRILDGAALAAGLSLKPRYTVQQFATAFRLVAEGLGVAIVPATMLAGLPPPGIVSRSLSEPKIVQHLGILRRRDRYLTPAAAAFLDVIRTVWPQSAKPLERLRRAQAAP